MIEFLTGLMGLDFGAAAGWIDFATSLIGSFAIAATLTKNKVDDRVAQVIVDVVNFLGANVHRATNAPDKP